MNLPQGEVAPLATTSKKNEETQEVKSFSHQIQKTVLKICYNDLDDENVKPVLSSLDRCEPSDESPAFSINVVKDFTSNSIEISPDGKDPKIPR